METMIKRLRTKDYNYNFSVKTGLFARWGKTLKDDPTFAPMPEILDIEVSEVCSGITGVPCSHCYKSNTKVGKNMDIDTFKKIIDNIPSLLQIAAGIGDIDSNKDLFKMFEYCREKNIVPNVTINGARMTDEYYDKLATLCGAVSVSRYNPKDVCYNAVNELSKRGLKQVNIHQLVSKETFSDCMGIISDAINDERLKGLNAIVFLMLKPKGKRNTYHMVDKDQYKLLVDFALESGVNIGFDSCSAPAFLDCVKDNVNYKQYEMLAESCESTRFSCYVNVEGKLFPCSFCEGEDGHQGIDVVNCNDFAKDVWNNEDVIKFRNKLICSKEGRCPQFDLL